MTLGHSYCLCIQSEKRKTKRRDFSMTIPTKVLNSLKSKSSKKKTFSRIQKEDLLSACGKSICEEKRKENIPSEDVAENIPNEGTVGTLENDKDISVEIIKNQQEECVLEKKIIEEDKSKNISNLPLSERF